MSCGGEVRKRIPAQRLPREIIDFQEALLHKLGCSIHYGITLGVDISLAELQDQYDAVILAPGRLTRGTGGFPPSLLHDDKIKINKDTFQTDVPGLFACGSCVGRTSMAVRSIAQGRQAAYMADCFLSARELQRERVFDSVVKKYSHGELQELLKGASPGIRIEPAKGELTGYVGDEAVEESRRCMHCDCYKSNECVLRKYAAAYDAHQHRYEIPGRKAVQRRIDHPFVVREMGKCIRCGRCVRLTRDLDIGLGFVQRGYETQVAMPFHHLLEEIPDAIVKKIVALCPTGALALREAKK